MTRSMYVLTTSVISRRPRIHKRLVMPLFFCDNFVNFHRRLKRIAHLELVNFLRVTMCKFSIFMMVR